MISKIFGSKKSEYVLEFDQAQGDKAPEQAAPENQAEPAPKTATVATEPAQPAAIEAPKKAAKAPKSKPAKTKPAKTKPEATKPVETAAPAPKPEPKKELPSLSSIQATPKGMTFASNSLMPKPTTSRRRPGPSLDMFKDMARQMGRR